MSDRAMRIEAAAREVVEMWCDSRTTPAETLRRRDTLREALALPVEERWGVWCESRGGGWVSGMGGTRTFGKWSEAHALAETMSSTCPDTYEARLYPASAEAHADTFPRAPKDEVEREARTHPAPACLDDSGGPTRFWCTLRKGHSGDHVAAGAAVIHARWPNVPVTGPRGVFSPPRAAVGEEERRAAMEVRWCDAVLAMSVCTRAEGHPGDHVSIRSDGTVNARWAQEEPARIVVGWRLKFTAGGYLGLYAHPRGDVGTRAYTFDTRAEVTRWLGEWSDDGDISTRGLRIVRVVRKAKGAGK